MNEFNVIFAISEGAKNAKSKSARYENDRSIAKPHRIATFAKAGVDLA